jgi:hypothetical protein
MLKSKGKHNMGVIKAPKRVVVTQGQGQGQEQGQGQGQDAVQAVQGQ